MKTNVITLEGKNAGDIELSDAIFGLEKRSDILHRVVTWQLAKRRAGTHQVKFRADIAGTTKRVGRQKGGGTARHGNRKSNIFIGGGVGVSSIQDEATGYSHAQNSEYEILQPVHGKHVYRFAYKITTGIDYQLREGVKGEIAYNFYNLGKNKSIKIDNIDNIKNRRFLIHNLTLGLRFDI